jgi:hypothetical protein
LPRFTAPPRQLEKSPVATHRSNFLPPTSAQISFGIGSPCLKLAKLRSVGLQLR